MAIESFAESLLADVRKQNRQQQSEREKEERKLLLASIGVGLAKSVGNELLKQQTEQFMQSEAFRSARQVARASDNIASQITAEWGQIDASKKDPLQYMYEKYKPIVEERMKAETENWAEGKSNYDGVLYSRTMELAKEALQKLEEGRNIINKGQLGKDVDRLDILAKDYRPDTVKDWVTGKMIGFFKGKTQADLDREEILSLKSYADDQTEGTRGYYAKQLQYIKEQYDRTGDLALSKKYAEGMMVNEPSPSERYTTEEKIDFKTIGNITVAMKTTVTKDNATGNIKISDPKYFKPTELQDAPAIAQTSLEAFNPLKFAQEEFKSDKYEIFVQQVAAANLLPSDIDSPEKYTALNNILKEYIAEPLNWKSPDRQKTFEVAAKVYFDTLAEASILKLGRGPLNDDVLNRELNNYFGVIGRIQQAYTDMDETAILNVRN